MEDLIDNLIKEIKANQRYKDYINASLLLEQEDIKSLLQDYQHLLDKQKELSQYDNYIDNHDIHDAVKDYKLKIANHPIIQDYYQKYYQLNDFLNEITNIVFQDISDDIIKGANYESYFR